MDRAINNWSFDILVHCAQASNNAAPTRMLKTNGAITSGLGRRAITQLDMSAASRLSAAISSSRYEYKAMLEGGL